MSLESIFFLADLHWILLGTCISTAIYYYILKTWNHFQSHGIPFDRGVPPFGSNFRNLFLQESWTETLKRLYYQHPNDRFIGLFEVGGGISFLIRDPELAKEVTTTNFDHFANKYDVYSSATDPFYHRMLSNLKGDSWKHMRSLLSPLFTGSKFKSVVLPSLVEAKQHFVQGLLADVANNGAIDVDMMEISTRSTIDAFGRSSLGIATDAVNNKDSLFKKTADSIYTNMGSLNGIQQFGINKFPWLTRYLFGTTAVVPRDADFVQDVIMDVVGERERLGVERADALGLLINARKQNSSQEKVDGAQGT